MVCHGYVDEAFRKVGIPVFDSIIAEYMETCVELSDKWDNDNLFGCEICGSKKDIVIQVCPINANQKGLFTKKQGMILFYVITVCSRHIGNDWFLYRHKGLRAFNEIEQKVVLSRFREYTSIQSTGIRYDISNQNGQRGVIYREAVI